MLSIAILFWLLQKSGWGAPWYIWVAMVWDIVVLYPQASANVHHWLNLH